MMDEPWVEADHVWSQLQCQEGSGRDTALSALPQPSPTSLSCIPTLPPPTANPSGQVEAVGSSFLKTLVVVMGVEQAPSPGQTL